MLLTDEANDTRALYESSRLAEYMETKLSDLFKSFLSTKNFEDIEEVDIDLTDRKIRIICNQELVVLDNEGLFAAIVDRYVIKFLRAANDPLLIYSMEQTQKIRARHKQLHEDYLQWLEKNSEHEKCAEYASEYIDLIDTQHKLIDLSTSYQDFQYVEQAWKLKPRASLLKRMKHSAAAYYTIARSWQGRGPVLYYAHLIRKQELFYLCQNKMYSLKELLGRIPDIAEAEELEALAFQYKKDLYKLASLISEDAALTCLALLKNLGYTPFTSILSAGKPIEEEAL